MMSDESDIMNVISRYFQLLDDRRPEPWGELLTEDVVIHLYNLVINGRDVARQDIFGGQVSGQHGKHIAVNPYIKVTGDRAESICDYFYVAAMGPTNHQRFEILDFGRYTDDLIKVDGAWLFKTRRIDVELFPLPPE
jgi:hypothetical protein